jgi:hypothetical protein
MLLVCVYINYSAYLHCIELCNNQRTVYSQHLYVSTIYHFSFVHLLSGFMYYKNLISPIGPKIKPMMP